MASAGKVKCDEFDGTTDVKVFLTKVEIVASIKGYEDEKKAQFLASKLLQPAFDIYMRLSAEDKKDFEKVKAELLKEFERGQLNREEAIEILSNRRREAGESALTFSYKLLELVKLAYSSFPDPQQKTVAKDYFMRGVHPDMQIALKSLATFKDIDINELATETMRLELAGVKSFGSKNGTGSKQTEVNLCEVNDLAINSIAEKVIEKLNLNSPGLQQNCQAVASDNAGTDGGIQYVAQHGRGASGRSGRGGGRGGGRGNNRGGGRGGRGSTQKKCRNCQSSDHLIRHCPQRFCQACGQRGHDQYSADCPNWEA